MSRGLGDELEGLFDAIVARHPSPRAGAGRVIGRSREGREIVGYRAGRGPIRVSLIAGCHADEPVGPRLLRYLADYLDGLARGEGTPGVRKLLEALDLWIIPHVNPDGEWRNRAWQTPNAAAYTLSSYLAGTVREPPGDDIEFGFPHDPSDVEARPEPRAVADWWGEAGPFDLHVTLHGMGSAAGPWFLVEPGWVERAGPWMDRCATRVAELGYVLHDVERGGEKGFHRIRRGFTTRPAWEAMRDHFLALGDPAMAARFRPNSMEHVRSLGGDPLTLVSEMPLFLLPGVGEELGPPDPVAELWSSRLDDWRRRLAAGEPATAIDDEAAAEGLRPMPVRDQMRLQWAMISAAVELVGARPV